MKQFRGVGKLVFTMLAICLLAACSGGGGSSGSEASATSTTTVSGVAAMGAPMIGPVFLKDSSTPTKELTGVINADGSFSFNVDGLRPPFILNARNFGPNVSPAAYDNSSWGVNDDHFSFINGPGKVNINPFTTLALSAAAGGADVGHLYNNGLPATDPLPPKLQAIGANLARAVTDIQTKFQPLFALFNASGVNPVTDPFVANHQGLDGLLDVISVDLYSTPGSVTIKNKATGSVIFSGSVTNILGGTLTQANFPQPAASISGPFPIGTWTGPNGVSFTVMQSVGNGRYSGTVTWPGLPGNGTVNIQGNEVLNFISSPMSGLLNVVFDNTSGGYLVGLVLTASSDQKTLTGTMALVSTKSGYTTPVNINDAVFTNGNTQPTTSVSVAISPTSPTVAANGTKNFTATVTGNDNTQVTWSVVETNGGSITTGGVYTSPATAGTYHVKAVSVADKTKSAIVAIVVTAAPNINNGPNFYLGTWKGPYSFSITLISHNEVSGYYTGRITYPAFRNSGVVQFGDATVNSTVAVYFETTGLSCLGTDGGGTNFGFYIGPVNGNQNQLQGELYIESSLAGYSHSITSGAIFNKQ